MVWYFVKLLILLPLVASDSYLMHVLVLSMIFGILRERTGTITASVVYHACCNMMVLFMSVHYW